jgi:hypothetical protein
MELRINTDDVRDLWVDRDNIRNDHGRQSFDVGLGGLSGFHLHFEDEADAVALAKAILSRMGENHFVPGKVDFPNEVLEAMGGGHPRLEIGKEEAAQAMRHAAAAVQSKVLRPLPPGV